MKPIKLIISALGPYAETMPPIDFREFEDKKLFLISGETGAGKTFLFDAITYALFGKTSGDVREVKNLRSQFAKPDVLTYVDFYFSHQGKEYRVYRAPSYERKSKTGNKMVTEKEQIILYEGKEVLAQDQRQVNQRIEEMLSINYAQFKQIGMIAQGQFYDLLTASTKDRTDILRNVFMTEKYQAMEEILKRRKGDADKECDRKKQSMIQYFGDVSLGEDSRFREQYLAMLENARQSGSVWNVEDMLDLISSLQAEDGAAVEAAEKELTKAKTLCEKAKSALALAEGNNQLLDRLEKLQREEEELSGKREEFKQRKAKLDRQKTAVRQVKPTYDRFGEKRQERKNTAEDIEEKKGSLLALTKAAEESGEKLAAAQEKQPLVDEYKYKAGQIDADREKYLQREKLKEDVVRLDGWRQEILAREKSLSEKERNLKEKLEELSRDVDSLDKKPVELVQLREELEKLGKLGTRIGKVLGEDYPRWRKRRENLEKTQKEYLAAKKIYGECDRRLRHAEDILEGCRAGILAKDLLEGMECPVCGNTHHPSLAHLPLESVSEEEVKSLQEETEQRRIQKEEAGNKSQREYSALMEVEERLQADMQGCLAEASELQRGEQAEEFGIAEELALADTSGGTERAGQAGAIRVEGREDIISLEESAEKIDKLAEKLRMTGSKLEMLQEEKVQKKESLQKECAYLEKCRNELAQLRGEESAKLTGEREALTVESREAESKYTASKATLQTLEELPFQDWKSAEAARDEALKQAGELRKEMEAARQEKEAADHKVTEVKASIRTLEDKKSVQEAEEKELYVQLDSLLKQHAFSGVEELLQYFITEASLSFSEKEIAEYESRVALNKSQLEQATADADGKERVDVEELRERIAVQENKVSQLSGKKNDLEYRLRNNGEKKANIEGMKSVLDQEMKHLAALTNVHDLVRGTSRSVKITLEQYVQATGFDSIIKAANERLFPMSDCQFELCRQTKDFGKKSNAFLDLEVMDYHTGKIRSVKDLSGGESFKASLSLALGLSDTVASNRGGVQMNALFIDEGFGTLDKKSIEYAMESLLKLSQSNKLVGIISHREELKEKIDQQIQVEKSKEGSSFRIVSALD